MIMSRPLFNQTAPGLFRLLRVKLCASNKNVALSFNSRYIKGISSVLSKNNYSAIFWEERTSNQLYISETKKRVSIYERIGHLSLFENRLNILSVS